MCKRLTVAIGAPGLEENPDYIDRESRLENRDALNERINALTSQKTTAEWVALLNEAGIPCGPIYSVDQTLADPQVETLGMAPSVQHPILGELRVGGVGALQVLHYAVYFVHAPPATKRDAGDEGAHVVSRKKFVHGVFLLEWVVFGGRIGGLFSCGNALQAPGGVLDVDGFHVIESERGVHGVRRYVDHVPRPRQMLLPVDRDALASFQDIDELLAGVIVRLGARSLGPSLVAEIYALALDGLPPVARKIRVLLNGGQILEAIDGHGALPRKGL